MGTKLYRNSSFYRPLNLIINNKEVELNNIIIYGDDGIICQTGRGFFENDNELEIKEEVVLRRTINLDRKENFVIKDKEYSFEPKYELYIYKDNVDLQYQGAKKIFDCVYQIYSVNGNDIMKFIKDLTTGKWEIRDKMDEEVKKMQGYKLPLQEEEIAEILKNIKKYNKQLLDIDNYAKNYEVTDEDNIERIG